MSDRKQQTEEKDELRDLDVGEERAEGVNGGYAPIVPDVELSLFKPRPPTGSSFRDLDLSEAEAEGVKGGALGDINGESQDNGHAAQIEVVSWKLSGASDRRR